MGKASINGGFNGKIIYKWRFLAGKIIYKWVIFHGYVSHNQMVNPLTPWTLVPTQNAESE